MTLKTQIDADLKRIPGAVQLEEQAGVPLIAIAGGAAVVFLILIYLIFGDGFVCNFVGFAFPAYASLKAIESDSKEDDTQWLTYWVVYASFCVVETFIEIIEDWIPYYFLFKFFFLIWLFAPMTLGANVVYRSIVRPFFKKNEAEIDAFGNKIEGVVDEGVQGVSEVADSFKGVVQETVKDIVDDDAAHEKAMEEIHAEEKREEEMAAADEQAEEQAEEQQEAAPVVDDAGDTFAKQEENFEYSSPAAEESAQADDDDD